MATHSSILAWRIPWTEKPGGLQSIGSERVRHDWSDLACIIGDYTDGLYKEVKDTALLLPWVFCMYFIVSERICLTRTLLLLLLSRFSRVWLCATDRIDGSPPGSPVPGILQARTLEWTAISFSNSWKWKVKVKSLSRVQLLATPWTAAYQVPPSMGFSRQEYWSGVPLPSPDKNIRNQRKHDILTHTPSSNQCFFLFFAFSPGCSSVPSFGPWQKLWIALLGRAVCRGRFVFKISFARNHQVRYQCQW